MKETDERTCSSHFKAASNARVSEALLDTGLVSAVCRHDVPLRLYNIRKTGERLKYALRLLKSILADPSCPPQLVIMYDISCKFKKFVQKRVDNDVFARLRFVVGTYTFQVCTFIWPTRHLPHICTWLCVPSPIFTQKYLCHRAHRWRRMRKVLVSHPSFNSVIAMFSSLSQMSDTYLHSVKHCGE